MDVALIILDGWGISDVKEGNAIRAANTPVFDRLCLDGKYGTLETGGRSVGLPEGGVGNSKVGHLTIGVGRIIEQEHTQINRAIENGSFFQNEVLRVAFENVKSTGNRVHVIGLLSDAGVHSDDSHIHAIIEMASKNGVEVATHVITDGRDTPPKSSKRYVSRLEKVVEKRRTGRIATITGRYYAMDRDGNTERTLQAHNAIVEGKSNYGAKSGLVAIEDAYTRGETDEFVKPTVIENGDFFSRGDIILMANFRADRMRQMSLMCKETMAKYYSEEESSKNILTMSNYDESYKFPVAFPTAKPQNTIGEILSEEGLTQLRIAETEKYAHVTYFLNGGREEVWKGEIRKMIPSPKVPTYDQQPEMNARKVTETAIKIIEEKDPNVLILNYANPDMVGHTGVFDATVKSVEVVDEELGKLVEFLREKKAKIIVIADHGNAEEMGTKKDPLTSHTFNPAPCICIGLEGDLSKKDIRKGGGLSDISPTILDLLGIEKPSEMTGKSLLQ
jgi:2,3-bisphosphoglycerate-independent phosphoglycerate mutase